MITLGQRVRDTITGFQGIAIGRTEWLHGCFRIGIESEELNAGKPIDPVWFDEMRVEILAQTNHQVDAPQKGGPRPDPVRHNTGMADKEAGANQRVGQEPVEEPVRPRKRRVRKAYWREYKRRRRAASSGGHLQAETRSP